MNPTLPLLFVLGCSIAAFQPLSARAEFPLLYLKPVVRQQFHSPTNILSAPDSTGRVFVTDQPGRIFVVQHGMMLPVPFLDISSTAPAADRKVLPFDTGYSERGLLGMAFHPGYAQPASPGFRRFYLNYTKVYEPGVDPPPPVADHTPNSVTVISEFLVSAEDPGRADPGSERRLLAFTQPQSNHNGGQLAFGPDGLLYIASGDGGSADDNNVGHTGGASTSPRPTGGLGNGQDKTTFLGKILRIDPLDPDGAGPLVYGIPADNPFAAQASPANIRKEIYAYGLRNPWRFSFDSRPGGTGRLFCCDVGQLRVEEVNLILSGGNYGWRYLEGTEMPLFSSGALTNPMPHPGGTLIPPIAQYAHTGVTGTSLPRLGLSGTGGYVYRGTAIPALQGKYVFGDYGATSGAPSGRLMGLEETAPGSGTFTLTEAIPLVDGNPFAHRVLCLGEDSQGELYVGTKVSAGVLALENGLPNGGLYQLAAAPANPPPIVLEPAHDTTIYGENATSASPELSNGTSSLVTGLSAENQARRALIRFDLAGLPAGFQPATASLQMQVASAVSNTSRNFTMHRLTSSWGEGTAASTGHPVPASPGDATWLSRFAGDPSRVWVNAGGDFEEAPSAMIAMGGPGPYSWQSLAMLQDLQAWQADGASNQGWILLSDETNQGTAKVLHSRSDEPSLRPKLTLVAAGPFASWTSQFFPGHLTGQYLDPAGDPDGDGLGNQIEYGCGLHPQSPDTEPVLQVFPSLAAPQSKVEIRFPRDSAATDTTLRLQQTRDFTSWSDLVTSTSGAPAAAVTAGVNVSEEADTGTRRNVTVQANVPPADARPLYLRLAVERTP